MSFFVAHHYLTSHKEDELLLDTIGNVIFITERSEFSEEVIHQRIFGLILQKIKFVFVGEIGEPVNQVQGSKGMFKTWKC